jgi:polysaccharide export outer membrane protein
MSGAAGLAIVLSGCASLPSSGPTAKEVAKGMQPVQNTIGMTMVDVDADVVGRVATQEREADALQPTLATLATSGANDVVGPGDVLSISIYEVGATLFSGAQPGSDALTPSARPETFAAVLVDRDGLIKLPYTGQLKVAGLTPSEIQGVIERAYKGKSQSLQALVEVRSNLSQAVFISGDVRRPGRIELSLQHERLLDAIATAGGTVSQTQDMVVRFTRGNRTLEERLDRIVAGAPDDLVLVAGDRAELIHEPESFVTFGATGKVSQVSFDQTNLTLAEAIARAGGPSDPVADPRSVFLFRYSASTNGAGKPVPTIYRLNLMQPASYFLAQRFAMRDKDVVYVSNAGINRTAKFVGIINSLFSPFVAVRAVGGF